MTDEETEHRRKLDVLQSMIDTSADRLEGLRTKCATSAELTQQEIRTLEGKIIKLFSTQLTTKARLRELSFSNDLQHLPSVRQWLQVVGLCSESVQAICSKVKSIEALQDKSEHELRMLLGCDRSNNRQEEFRRLNRALHNLKKYTEIVAKGECESGSDLALYWDSWDRAAVSPRQQRSRAGRCSVPSEDHPPLSPPGTPPPATTPVIKSKGLFSDRSKVPSTPPPKKKNHTGVLIPDSHPLTKSKSHESQLANKVDGENNNTESGVTERRGRLATEPGPGRTSPLSSSPSKSPPGDSQESSYKCNSLQVPKSPRTPTITRGMAHVIAHRFTITFKMVSTCDYCDKPMFMGTGLRCKDCKYKCHRDCESKVPPSCGLPRELVDEFRKTFQNDAQE